MTTRKRTLMVALAAAAAITACGCLASQAGRDANSGIKSDIALLREEMKAGRDVNSGLSSRGITFIALGGMLCYVAIRWDFNRSNRKTTERAIRKAANGTGKAA